jgi:hypothetical protein
MNYEAMGRVFEMAARRVASGWCQGQDEDGIGRMCMSAAVDFAIRETRADVSSIDVMNTLRDLLPAPYEYVVDYNDEEGRTQEEVVLALQRAATVVKGDYK